MVLRNCSGFCYNFRQVRLLCDWGIARGICT